MVGKIKQEAKRIVIASFVEVASYLAVKSAMRRSMHAQKNQRGVSKRPIP
jgi:hypothetical protein